MKKFFSIVLILGITALLYMKRDTPIAQDIDLRTKEVKDNENKKIQDHVSSDVDQSIIAKINDRVDDQSFLKASGKDQGLSPSDINDVIKVVDNLSDCLLKNTCKDFKENERFYDPNEGSFHRSLVKSLSFLREKVQDNEDVTISDDQLQKVMAISNDEVQAEGLLLADALNNSELVALRCRDFTNSNILNVLMMIEKRKDSTQLMNCLDHYMQRASSMALYDVAQFLASSAVDVKIVTQTKKTYCSLLASKDESYKRVGLKYRSVLEKYDLTCP